MIGLSSILDRIDFKSAFALLFFLMMSCWLKAQNEIYMFSYFKANGQDGLHLATSQDGLIWESLGNDSSYLKPALSRDKLMRDPCIIRGGDNKFHMVWTVSWTDPGIGYASSTDLIHWSAQQYIPVMAHEPLTKNAWAPEITFEKKTKTYLIYWASTVPGKFAAGDSLGDNNHRIYFCTTKDFKTFTKTDLLYEKGFNVIDASIVKHDDNFIMFLKDETKNPKPQKNIRIATSKYLDRGYSQPSAPITGNYWAEGPTAFKKDGKWILYFDKYTEGKYGAISSADLKTWTDISSTIKLPHGIRHGSIFTIRRKEFKKLKAR